MELNILRVKKKVEGSVGSGGLLMEQ